MFLVFALDVFSFWFVRRLCADERTMVIYLGSSVSRVRELPSPRLFSPLLQ